MPGPLSLKLFNVQPTTMPLTMTDIPPEVILHIFSYLDIPDLAFIAQFIPSLAHLAEDPALHRHRLNIVAPSRVKHSLFGLSPQGLPLRPTVGDLIQRGVMRGNGLERHWRMGHYFYSRLLIQQYEHSLILQRRHVCNVVQSYLRRQKSRPGQVEALHRARVLPDVEYSSRGVSRSLLPVMRQLKWSRQRDQLAKVIRDAPGFTVWLETRGHAVLEESERVRLATCPDIRKMIAFYEGFVEQD
ncbi:hypothetical protein BD779DRAFT_1486764 [Infundibulicybe gibba]|nr:hypothetical protein BD779DRAFT_1486764 [Infundibulicybe gibba]